MRYTETKWNQKKVEELMKKYGWIFESNENGCYYDAYVEFYGKKRAMQLFVSKSSISVQELLKSYWKGIKSYKKLDEVLKHYNNDIEKNIWRSLSFAEKFNYVTQKECKEKRAVIIEDEVSSSITNIEKNLDN